MATRRRLLDATRDLLARDGPFDLKACALHKTASKARPAPKEEKKDGKEGENKDEKGGDKKDGDVVQNVIDGVMNAA